MKGICQSHIAGGRHAGARARAGAQPSQVQGLGGGGGGMMHSREPSPSRPHREEKATQT